MSTIKIVAIYYTKKGLLQIDYLYLKKNDKKGSTCFSIDSP